MNAQKEAVRIKTVMNEMPVAQIYVQECKVNGQTAPIYADNSSYPAFQTFPAHVPLSGPSNLQCHMTTIHTALAQGPPSGKTKWKVSKQSLHRYNFPPHQMQPLPQMFFNNYPGGPLIPPSPSAPYEPFYYGAQPYFPGSFPGGSVYRPQIQSPPLPTAPPPRPYLTITQFNCPPVGYSPFQTQPSPTNLVFGPPPRDRRCGSDTQRRHFSSHIPTSSYELERPSSPRILEHSKIIYPNHVINDQNSVAETGKRNDLKSDSSTSFEFTIQPEQFVNSLCEEKECYQCQTHIVPSKIAEENLTSMYGTPRTWNECNFMDPMRIEDDDLTKFIVDGCLKAEAIAVRNQHRPCFKNIKHLCTRTRNDILKPRTTVANIHSQGIPWATKDFIFAFVRLINCWYILKGYLDDHEGSLGKIETALIPEFKDCYQRWQIINKEMVKHLINIFVNLDNGITVQNAEIFSSFNQARNIISTCSLPCEGNSNSLNLNESKSCPTQLSKHTEFQDNQSRSSSVDNRTADTNQNNIEKYIIDDKIKYDGKSVPGILRVKNVFSSTSAIVNKAEKELDDGQECKHHKVYMKPGSYRIPKKSPSTTPVEGTKNCAKEKSESDKRSDTLFLETTPDDVWKSALERFERFMKTVIKSTDTTELPVKANNSYASSDKEEVNDLITKDIQDWVNDHDFENCLDENVDEIPTAKSFKTEKPKNCGKKTTNANSKNFRKQNEEDKKNHKIGEFKCSKKLSLSSNLELSQISSVKFEKIINVLWHQKFAKFITFEVNVENVPDYYKYINNPMFLYKVMNNLKQKKYIHPYQVVHDLRLIVRNAEFYVKKRPDWWFEKCLISFSKELEYQLAVEFSAIDFSSITGDPSEPPQLELNIYGKKTDEEIIT